MHQGLYGLVRHRSDGFSLGHGHEHVDAGLGVHGPAHHVQAVGNQGVFQLQDAHRELLQLVLQCADVCWAFVCRPRGLGGHQIECRGLRLNEAGQIAPLGVFVGVEVTPAVHRGFELHQAAVQTSLLQRWCHVADEGGTAAPLGDRAFGWVVGGVKVKVGQVLYQAVWPATA